jgi:hypothetical protein
VDLTWRRGAQDDVRRIDDAAVREEVALAILDIADDPSIGEELRYLHWVGDLSDCRKLYVDVPPDERPPGPKRYRIVYRLVRESCEPSHVEIIAVGVRADEEAYRRALVRLGRPPGRRIL